MVKWEHGNKLFYVHFSYSDKMTDFECGAYKISSCTLQGKLLLRLCSCYVSSENLFGTMGVNSNFERPLVYLDTLINKFTNIEICNIFTCTTFIIEMANCNRIKKVVLGSINCLSLHFKTN